MTLEKGKDLKVEIIAIGTELLTPHFHDTNSLYLTQRLNDLGLEVAFKSIVGDEMKNLVESLRIALSRSDIVIGMGGLGPTQDDRTREALALSLNRKLIYKADLFRKIEERFKKRNLEMPSVNKKQAYIIEGSHPLPNLHGTAPGLWLETVSHLMVFLPGPPHELKPMFESCVWPRLQKLKTSFTERRILKITGLAESAVESLMGDVYPRDLTLNLSILASPGQIEIHLSGHSEKSKLQAEKKVGALEEILLERLKDNVFSTKGEELEEVTGRLLRGKKETLAVAESCSGGLLSHRITSVPGSSDYFLQGVVAYSNTAKIQILGVPSELIRKYGAVSPQVGEAMAKGIRKKAQATYSLSITGIAGPAGGTREKPVGLVYTALSSADDTEVVSNRFLGNRSSIKFQSSQKALDMLRRHLLK